MSGEPTAQAPAVLGADKSQQAASKQRLVSRSNQARAVQVQRTTQATSARSSLELASAKEPASVSVRAKAKVQSEVPARAHSVHPKIASQNHAHSGKMAQTARAPKVAQVVQAPKMGRATQAPKMTPTSNLVQSAPRARSALTQTKQPRDQSARIFADMARLNPRPEAMQARGHMTANRGKLEQSSAKIAASAPVQTPQMSQPHAAARLALSKTAQRSALKRANDRSPSSNGALQVKSGAAKVGEGWASRATAISSSKGDTVKAAAALSKNATADAASVGRTSLMAFQLEVAYPHTPDPGVKPPAAAIKHLDLTKEQASLKVSEIADAKAAQVQSQAQLKTAAAAETQDARAATRQVKKSKKRMRLAQEALLRPHIPKGRRRFVHISFWQWCLGILLALVLVGGGAAYKYYQDFESIGTYVVPAQTDPYELKEGATVSKVVHQLAGERYNTYLLDLWVKFNHFNYPVIQKGPYLIDGVKTLNQLLADMRDGNIIKIKLPTITLIEGMTASTFKKRLQSNSELIQDPNLGSIFDKSSYFMERTLVKDAKDFTLLEAVGGAHDSLEGLLMPATYEYVKDQYTTTYLVQQALIKMATFMREHYIERNHDIDDVLGSPYKVLILASLVERESSLEQERPLIAGVFINRLKANIKLQTDPAVMYGVSPDFKGPLRLSQLKKDTPYNTYTREGLPPTPIAMPSESAILAVLNPKDSKYLFFVAKGPDPKAGHYFSETLREHNQAVKKYREAVKRYKHQMLELEKERQRQKQLAEQAKLKAEAQAKAEVEAQYKAKVQSQTPDAASAPASAAGDKSQPTVKEHPAAAAPNVEAKDQQPVAMMRIS